MVIDTSAILAFLWNEPEAERIEELLDVTPECRMSAVNDLECRIVLWRRHGAQYLGELDLVIVRAEIVVEPFDSDQAMLAFDAYRRFGKGGGHPAQLNIGDCAAYALAISHGLPLLYKGDDFSMTDVRSRL
jgi:ribonuclease VapC